MIFGKLTTEGDLQISRIFSGVVAIGLLVGCAQSWEKPGTTAEEFDQIKATCTSTAYSAIPPAYRQIQTSPGYMTPTQTHCVGSVVSPTCIATGGQFVPPILLTVDDNQVSRDDYIKDCYHKNGWRPAEPR